MIALAALAVLALLGVGISQALQDSGSGETTTAPDARQRSYSVAEAGAVTIDVQSGRISVVSIQRVEGWTPKVVRQSGPKVRVEFVRGPARRVFVAGFADGELITRVRRINGGKTSSSVTTSSVTSSSVTSSTGATSSTLDDATSTTVDDRTSTTFDDDDATSTTFDDDTSTTIDDNVTSTTLDDDATSTTFDDSTSTTIDDDDDTTSTTVREETPPTDRSVTYQVANAGSVTVRISDGQLTLLDVQANSGWTFEVDDSGGDTVRVEFERGDDDVEFRLQFHGSELRLEIG
jgi:hypothetical protein